MNLRLAHHIHSKPQKHISNKMFLRRTRSLIEIILFAVPLFKTSFAVFGGEDGQASDDATMMTNKVTLVNMETKKTCLHSELPLAIREPFVYDYKDTLLVCSATSGQNRKNLQCFEWDVSVNNWKVFPVTGFENTDIDTDEGTFISSARIPGNI